MKLLFFLARSSFPHHRCLSSTASFQAKKPIGFSVTGKDPSTTEQLEALATETFKKLDKMLANPSVKFHDEAVFRNVELRLNRLLEACRSFEKQDAVSDTEIESARKRVREAAKDFLASGPFGSEIINWPRGPGSSTAMEYVYEGINLPKYNIRAHYADWFLRNADLAVAVRSRKDTLRDLLKDELVSKHASGSTDILDLANGPALSLKEVMYSKEVPQSILCNIQYEGYDTDAIVQQNNRDWIREMGFIPAHNFRFIEGDALRTPFQEEKKYDIIYSTGFFDYLPDSRLTLLWKNAYKALKPGGVLFLSVKDSNMYHSQTYHYLIHWDHFLQRPEEQFDKIIEKAGLPVPEKTTRDGTGIILFHTIRKPLD